MSVMHIPKAGARSPVIAVDDRTAAAKYSTSPDSVFRSFRDKAQRAKIATQHFCKYLSTGWDEMPKVAKQVRSIDQALRMVQAHDASLRQATLHSLDPRNRIAPFRIALTRITNEPNIQRRKVHNEFGLQLPVGHPGKHRRVNLIVDTP